MNRVTRISRIRGFGVFRSFQWPDELPNFRRYNVVYGWNGSGKTLLSRIFAGLQTGKKPACDQVVIELSSGERVANYDWGSVPERVSVRVFNGDFVHTAVYGSQGPKPIYVFGGKAKEKQEKLDAILVKIAELREEFEQKRLAYEKIKQDVDTMCSDSAKVIRETLSIPGRQYEREQFRKDVQEFAARGESERYLLNAVERQHTLRVIHSERRKKLSFIDFSFESLSTLFDGARDLCGKSVVANAIEELQRQPNVNKWVEEGLQLHKELGSRSCLFCGQPLPTERLQMLEGHFSKEYKRLVREIDQMLGKIDSVKQDASNLNLKDPDLLYLDLREEYTSKQSGFHSARDQLITALDELAGVLEKKRNNPFQSFKDSVPSFKLTDVPISAVIDLIARHNETVDNHDREVERAKRKLKDHMIAEKVSDYRLLEEKLEGIRKNLDNLRSELDGLEKQRQELERDLLDHRRPAEELNHELASYLGHSEIHLEVDQTGYTLVRNGNPAESLSDGEKTAIAFLYFLKSLIDRNFDMNEGVVVIDDPVSSLDSTALYHAFGFMKSRVKKAGQLSIFTHNFLFFRQVKDWFSYLPKREVRYYMLSVVRDDVGRNSRLVQLDPLLRDYESEYHYLFSLVFRSANAESGNSNLTQYYYLPNVIRRLLEAFLEFKVPGKGSIHKRFEGIAFDPVKKDRIRRFCDAHSHTRVIDEPEQDPVILAEAPQVAKDVMDLIQAVDENHFDGMRHLIEEYEHSPEFDPVLT